MRLFVVYPSAGSGWKLLCEGDPVPLHFDEKEAAIGYGRCMADANRPSALRVETAYGAVETAWRFEDVGVADAVTAEGW
jgi:hypothetical protein